MKEKREIFMSGYSNNNFIPCAMHAHIEQILHHLALIDKAKNPQEMHDIVYTILELMGRYTGAERVYIFDKIDDSHNAYSNTFEWCAEGIVSQMELLRSVSADEMPCWMAIFAKGENIVIPDIEEIKITMPKEYDLLKMQSIRSEVAIPIFYHECLSGFIGLDNPDNDLPEMFMQLLTLVGGHMGSARENSRMLELLEHKQEILQQNLHELEKERQILMVLCEDNTSVFRVNLMTDTAETVKIDLRANVSKLIIPDDNKLLCFTKEMKAYYDKFIVKESIPNFFGIISCENLMRELSDKDRFAMRYKSVPNSLGHMYFEMRVTKIRRSNDDFQVLVDFRHIDDIVIEEKKHQQELEAALKEANMQNDIISAISKLYFLIYRIDLKADYYEEISSDGKVHRLTDENDSASFKMNEICDKFVAAEYQERARRFFDFKTLADQLKNEDTIAIEYLATDGNWHLARFIVQTRDEDGNAVRLLYVTRLISEEKRREKYWIVAAEEANKANEAKSEFLSRMSHDIRTPMNVIMGFANIAVRNLDDRDKLKDCLDKIRSSGDNLQQLIDNVLDISRIESGEFKMVSQPVKLSELFGFYCDSASGMMTRKKLCLTSSAHDIIHNTVITDKLRLGQIYMNLLSNAVKYTPEGGTIRFEIYEEAMPEADRIRLVSIISDTGIGMDPEFMKVMYSEFSRAVDTRVNKVRGSGLGLSIVKKIVDIMGGTIDVQSEPLKGTTFTVKLELPFVAENDETAANDNEKLITFPDHPITLLVAEDNDLNYEIEAELLGLHSIKCVRAVNGADCVEKFSKSEPGAFDAVLMDMQMPVMSGPEAAAAIRALPHKNAKTIPIIAVTANAYQEDIQKCLDAGMNSHLSKPIDMNTLLKTIAEFVH